jgi:hypothetical protein
MVQYRCIVRQYAYNLVMELLDLNLVAVQMFPRPPQIDTPLCVFRGGVQQSVSVSSHRNIPWLSR